MTSSDTICNNTSPPLADIVHFGLLCIVVILTVLKCIYYEEGLIPLWPVYRIVWWLALVSFVTTQAHR